MRTNWLAFLPLLFAAVVLQGGCDGISRAFNQGTGTQASPPKKVPLPADLADDLPAQRPELAAPRGLNTEPLFAESLRSDDARFDRLEAAVQNLQTTLNNYLPAIENLSAIESEIEELVAQLQTLLEEPAPLAAPPPPVRAETIPRAPTVADTSPAPQTSQGTIPTTPSRPAAAAPTAPVAGSVRITGLRVSDSPDKTRIVLDGTAPLSIARDFDAGEQILILELGNASVNTDPSAAARKSQRVNDAIAESSNGRTTMIFSLSGVSRVGAGESLPPANGKPQYRYYIDLFD